MSGEQGPDATFFPGGERAKVLEQIEHLAQWTQRVTLLTGPAGAGKSTLLARLRAQLRLGNRVNLVHPHLSVLTTPRELLVQLVAALGVEASAEADDGALRRQLIQNVAAERASERATLIVIDDVHELAPDVVQGVCALINDAAPGGALNVLLAGDRSLRARLDPGIDAHEIRLKPFTYHEAKLFLREPALAAGGGLDEAGMQAVHTRAGGWPGAIQNEFRRELRKRQRVARLRFPYALAAAVALVAALLITVLAMNEPKAARTVDPLALPGQDRSAGPTGGTGDTDPSTAAEPARAPVSLQLPRPPALGEPAPQPTRGAAATVAAGAQPAAPDASAPPPTVAAQAPTKAAEAVADPNAWVHAQPSDHYTLQLVGLSQREAAERFARAQAAHGARLIRTRRGGQSWYLVLAGSYPDRATAEAALAALPRDGGPTPWLRTFVGIQEELR